MSEFLDYDPLTGISHYFDLNEETNMMSITTKQDVSGLLEWTKQLRNSGEADKGIKESWWLYAKVPAVIQLQLRQKGINLTDPDATKKIIQEINEHYPALKVTQKKDGGIAPKLFVPGVKRAD